MSSFIPGPDGVALPKAFRHLVPWHWQQVTIGKSDATVWKISTATEALFLKSAPVHPLSELPGEAERLGWLTKVGISAPRLAHFEATNDRYWLLMQSLPGRDLTHLTDQPKILIDVLATALRQLHALDITRCPFDHRLTPRLAAGARNAAAGLVDETDFDTARSGWTTPQVLAWLDANRPVGEDLVVTHGDASLPNLIAEGDRLGGIIDCGRIGVADRWQDLAIACRSLAFNGGRDHVEAFLAAYGAPWDEARYTYYCTLDELF